MPIYRSHHNNFEWWQPHGARQKRGVSFRHLHCVHEPCISEFDYFLFRHSNGVTGEIFDTTRRAKPVKRRWGDIRITVLGQPTDRMKLAMWTLLDYKIRFVNGRLFNGVVGRADWCAIVKKRDIVNCLRKKRFSMYWCQGWLSAQECRKQIE